MKRPRASKAKYYRSVFRRVMSRYEEFRESNRFIYSAEKFYSAIAREGTGGGNPLEIKVTISDFMADVELAARRVLQDSPIHWVLFYEMFIKGNEAYGELVRRRMTDEAFIDMKHAMQEVVGVAFKAARIAPVEQYFRGREFR